MASILQLAASLAVARVRPLAGGSGRCGSVSTPAGRLLPRPLRFLRERSEAAQRVVRLALSDLSADSWRRRRHVPDAARAGTALGRPCDYPARSTGSIGGES